MTEFYSLIKSNFFLIAYGLTLVISLVTYRKYFNTILKYFPIIIAYTFLNELLGVLIRYTDYFSLFFEEEYAVANSLIYNIFDLVFFGYFFYVYWHLTKLKETKKIIVYGAFLCVIANIINAIFYDPMKIALYYANAISCWILLFICILYFRQLRPNLNWKEQRHNLMFWISSGIVIFHFFFPFLFVTGYLNPEVYYKYNLQTVLRIFIVLMYAIFSIGFIVSRKRSFQ